MLICVCRSKQYTGIGTGEHREVLSVAQLTPLKRELIFMPKFPLGKGGRLCFKRCGRSVKKAVSKSLSGLCAGRFPFPGDFGMDSNCTNSHNKTQYAERVCLRRKDGIFYRYGACQALEVEGFSHCLQVQAEGAYSKQEGWWAAIILRECCFGLREREIYQKVTA